jgi:hypothetical protein
VKLSTAGAALAVVVLAGSLAACGGGKAGTTDSAGTVKSTASPSASPHSAAPKFRTLDQATLTAALLPLTDMPTGYSEDPDKKEGADKTFCNYQQPHTSTAKASRSFVKGGGLGSEIASVGLRQFATAEQAKASFDALVTAMQTCREETVDGQKYTYALMSLPKIGDGIIGIRITTSQGVTVLQGFAPSGLVLANTGTGGLVSVSGDTVGDLLDKQVNRYVAAARP